MQRRARGRLACGLWCLAFAGLTGALAWKFGWLPVDVALVEPETGTLAGSAAAGTETEKPSPSATDADAGLPPLPEWAEVQAEPDVFAAQSEPQVTDDPHEVDESPFFGRRPAPQAADRHEPAAVSANPAVQAAVSGGFTRRAEADVPGSSVGEDDDPFAVPPPTAPLRRSQAADASAAGRGFPGDEEAGAPGRELVGPRPRGATEPGVVPASFEVPVDRDPRLDEIERLLQDGETLAAHKELSKLWWKEPELRPLLQQPINRTARTIYFSPQPHFMDPYVVQPGDQLRKVARQYQVPWEYLAGLNQVDPRRIRAGQRLKVIKGPFAAVVDLGRFELTVHAHGYFVRRYPVGIGKDGSSPVGKFTVLDKVVDPQYTDPDTGRVLAPDDPENPLGGRWINLGDSYGIHGTIEPQSIGRSESRGCIRMRNEDVREVYDLLEVGSEVIIRP